MERQSDDRTVLAGEYVLGTLDADARREAEALIGNDEDFRKTVWWWERRFAGLGLRLPAVTPRPVVWLGVLRRIESAAPAALRPRPARYVQAWAWMATAASVVLGAALLLQLQRTPQPPEIVTERIEVPVAVVSYVTVLQMPESSMQWAVSATPERAQLTVRASGEPPASIGERDAELWLIADEGPVSLGVMPRSGEVRRALPEGLNLSSGRVLAVSLEPRGGSPTGQPTGPVVTTAEVLQAG